jgi:hypothetical protein
MRSFIVRMSRIAPLIALLASAAVLSFVSSPSKAEDVASISCGHSALSHLVDQTRAAPFSPALVSMALATSKFYRACLAPMPLASLRFQLVSNSSTERVWFACFASTNRVRLTTLSLETYAEAPSPLAAR